MNLPNIRHEFFNEDSGIHYIVMAYRNLSQGEVIKAIAINLMLMKKKDKPKRGETRTFYLPPDPESS
jgi:hypothetical protein